MQVKLKPSQKERKEGALIVIARRRVPSFLYKAQRSLFAAFFIARYGKFIVSVDMKCPDNLI